MIKKQISVIGGGASALLFLSFIDTSKYDVQLFEKNKAIGRKFLVAGNGGFNLTHGEDLGDLMSKYVPNGFLNASIIDFDNSAVREWFSKIGVPTFKGSSHRIFPEKGIKPIEVLNAIKKKVIENNITIHTLHEFDSWTDGGALVFKHGRVYHSDLNVFCLGGASWSVTGSDGKWASMFKKKGIAIKAFQGSNGGVELSWSKDFLQRHEGKPLKNIACQIEGQYSKGEVVITTTGLEGNAIYALSHKIRSQLNSKANAKISIDFKPTLEQEVIFSKLKKLNGKSISTHLRTALNLSSAQVDILKLTSSKEEFLDLKFLSGLIKKVPLIIDGYRPIDECISTVGGIDLSGVDQNFELLKMKNNFCIGEMLDWDAPTGGYLLQACFSMGKKLADYFNQLV